MLTQNNYKPSFTCKCGQLFFVPRPSKYSCRKCGHITYYEVDPEQWEMAAVEKQVRQKNVVSKVAKNRKLIAAIKQRSPGQQYGDAVAKFEALATKYQSRLASDLTQILHACGCSREVAIAELNKQGWPQ